MGDEILGEEYLKSIDCPVTNCVFSHDRNFLPQPTDYDALVFHVGDFNDIDDLPEVRREDQIYIMANEEPPFFSRHNLNYDRNFFNMTLTFRLDSDILWNYGLFFDIETGSVVAPSKYAKWREPEIVDDPQILEFVTKSKSKLAAWFVSHCDAPSNRESLTKKIQEFMEVDVYGDCGNLTCPMGRTIYDKGNRQHCTDMLNSTYKFYLSFENSICTDYMTEKVFLNMDNFIVPILYNGITDMQHFLPPHSYIHVNDFSSVEDLVNYLKYLDKNPQEYANYFWWKKYYKVTENVHKYSYCDMCMKINSWNVKKKRKEYLDIAKWNSHEKCYNMRVNF
ncbi:unnamed protein product [Chironomus riparius]|uniref:Fucosyltransferase n=1 Tax=Chironomus riparius TaxID=315576 RepID=A0A9N9S3Y7_9DIPT|nr:unnamed protein product [Chironomus riparius]